MVWGVLVVVIGISALYGVLLQSAIYAVSTFWGGGWGLRLQLPLSYLRFRAGATRAAASLRVHTIGCGFSGCEGIRHPCPGILKRPSSA